MVLVIAIDKDNDYGRKGGVKCPVIGHDEVLKAVNALGLADPEDSDTNVGFAALKVAKAIGGVPVIICGEGKKSFRDDVEVSRELDFMREKYGEEEVILVTDGAEDESIIPMVSSRFKILGVERITVKQLEGVETFYYIVVKYLKEILSSPETAKIVLGIPGLVLLLIGLSVIISTWYPGFYSAVKNFIIGFGTLLFGVYLFKVGFGLKADRKLFKDFVSASVYMIIGFTFIIGSIRVYQLYSSGVGVMSITFFSVNVGMVMLVTYVLGKIVSEYLNGREKLYYYLSFLLFAPVIYVGSLMIVEYVFEGIVRATDLVLIVAFGIIFIVGSGIAYKKHKKKR